MGTDFLETAFRQNATLVNVRSATSLSESNFPTPISLPSLSMSSCTVTGEDRMYTTTDARKIELEERTFSWTSREDFEARRV